MNTNPTPFEQLLEGATKGPWGAEPHPADRTLHVYGPKPDCRLICEISPQNRYDQMEIDANAQIIARCNPAVMREVWAALKGADNALKDYIPDLEARGASLNYGRSVLRKIDRALALLDGQTEKGGAE